MELPESAYPIVSKARISDQKSITIRPNNSCEHRRIVVEQEIT